MTIPDPPRSRILLINQFFQPEPNMLRGISFAHSLEAEGFDVEVATGFPNYPLGRLYDGYSMRPYRRDQVGGVVVHRLGHVVSHDHNAVRRILTYVSLAVAMFFFVAIRGRRYDLIWVQQGPATLAFAVGLLGSLRPPMVLDVQDLWPESVTSAGFFPGWLPLGLLSWFSAFGVRRAEHVVTLSDEAAQVLRERGARATTVVYNWGAEVAVSADDRRGAEECMSGLERPIVSYVGLLGDQQAVDVIIDAVAVADPPMSLVVGGDGPAAAELRAHADQADATVRFLGRVPAGTANAIAEASDALVMHLRETELSRTAVPSKLSSYVRSGRPVVVASTGAAAARAAETPGCLLVEPDRPRLLADALVAACRLDSASTAASMRVFYDERMSAASQLSTLASIARRAIGTADEDSNADT